MEELVLPVGHQPAQAQQQRGTQGDATHHPDAPRVQALLLRHTPEDDADEDDVVDAQRDLQRGEREQRDDALQGEQFLHGHEDAKGRGSAGPFRER